MEPNEVKHKALQSAIHDINAVFSPNPALKHIASRELLTESIVTVIGGAVTSDDKRVEQLKAETKEVYDILAGDQGAAVMTEAPTEAPTEAAPEAAECPAFGKDYDPSASECVECVQNVGCAAATTAAKAKPKKEKKPKKDKAAAKPAQTKPVRPTTKTPKPEGVPTKKQVIIEMVSRPEGATIQEMAEKITSYNYGDLEKNLITVKLWLRKLGIPVEKREDRWFVTTA